MTTHYWVPHVGGIERVARRQAEELTARGHHVRVLTSAVGGPGVDHQPGSLEVTRIPAWNGFEGMGVPWPVLSPAVFRVAERLVGWSDVVVCHGHVYAATLVAVWHAHRLGRPAVLVQHNPHVAYDRRALDAVQRLTAGSAGRWALDRADAVVVPSSATRDYVRSLTAREVTVVPWGIDLERLRPHPAEALRQAERRSLDIADGAVLIVAAGRMSAKNRFETLVDAAVAAAGTLPSLRCVIAGTGPAMDSLRERAAAGGKATVMLPGYLEEARLLAYLRCADVVVTTAGANEGFGLLVAEALASGAPVVTAGEGGQVDLVVDGVNGWFFDGTPGGLADVIVGAVGRIAADGREAWADRARRSVEPLTWERHCTHLEDVISSARLAARTRGTGAG